MRLHSSYCFGILFVAALLTGLSVPRLAEASCDLRAARLMSLQGGLDVQEFGPEEWKPVSPEQDFCPGDRVRTRLQSRATLELKNKTVISLNQQTTVVFSGLKTRGPSWLDLLKGIIYVRSRTPSSLDVRTRYVNAAIRGTEFLVSTDDDQSQVSVLEGTVDASNDKGGVTLTDGQAAIAKAGEAPVRKLLISPRDAVQWALYYPPVIDLQNLRQKTADPAVKQALSRYLDGDSLGALAILDSAGNPDQVLHAGLLIGMGRVEEARPLLEGIADADPRIGEVLALRSVVALAQNDKAKALELAQRATERQPQSAIGWTALSYVRQADFQLESALQAASQAAKLDPGNALARAREAELLASLGRRTEALDAAASATKINPRLARAWAVQGYAQLNEMDAKAAAESFRKAIDLDNSDPLPRFGLGLAKIRAGDLEAGTADLEIAANLDPNDSLTHSYLGKAYYEQKNSKVAATEFELAKQLDPKDPTPWFYGAIKKQTENREVEAVQDMRKAIELNGNRAVYRSKLLLDDDLAARGSALGRIYNQVGFQRLGQLEAFNSLNSNPANYTAHRLLSDTYLNVPRHEVARVSSLLQAQLLQSINITPLQPQQAENSLLTVSGLGPVDPSMNEFNPLFARNQVSLLPSGTVGSFNTYGNETVLSGIYDNWSGSLGQMHYATSGFRNNNDIDQNLYTAYLQAQVRPDFNIMAEYRHRDIEHGFIPLIFAPTAADLMQQNTYRRHETSDIYRLGSRWSPALSADLLASFAYQDQNEQVNLSSELGSQTGGALGRHAYSGEMQHIFRHNLADSVIGVGHIEMNGQLNSKQTNTLADLGILEPSQEPGVPPIAREHVSLYSTDQHSVETNGYAYFHPRFPDRMIWTIGLGVDSLKVDALNLDTTQVNPKVGLTWQIFDDTALRFAYFRTLRQVRIGEQTLEPVQVSGFNQLYDDLTGTRATRYGFALDQHINSQLSAGIGISQRDLMVPYASLFSDETGSLLWREQLYHGYLYWMPLDRVSARLEYTYEDFYNRDFMLNPNTPSTRTHTLPLTLSYFDPIGWFAQIKTTYVNQQVETPGEGYLQEDFALVDTSIGYRMPKRLGIIQFDIRNLFDQSFRYQSNYSRTLVKEQVPFFPDRAFYGRVTLSF
ncbi:MAG: TonB-dependent receptor [Candidatus Methylumidiphilus sp.]